MALLVGGVDAGLHTHQHHRQVFDVDGRVEPLLGERRPVAGGEPVAHQLIRVVRPAGDLVVEGQASHSHYLGCVRVGEPVHDIDIVGGLLQQQTTDVTSFGVPVLEVVVPAVADEVAAPYGLDLADTAGADDVTHGPHDVHVPHVVSDVQTRACAIGGLEDPGGSLEIDG